MQKISKNLPLKYQGYAIVMQEVPDEISLAFNIAGCTHKCEGCHSKNLWEYEGNYLCNDFLNILNANKDFISCVCFLGGDQNIEELYELCKISKQYNLKTCIYSGFNSIKPFEDIIFDSLLDYLKIGPYIKEYGGLGTITTNQKMYKILKSDVINNETKCLMIDITANFIRMDNIAFTKM